MLLGIKEKKKYADIDWLMPMIDAEEVLQRLNVRIDHTTGNELIAFCPDHHIFVGHEPSHPKWSLNLNTGQTNCLTEPRGSNLIWTIYRLLDLAHPRDAVKFALGTDEISEYSLQRARIRRFISHSRRLPELKQLKAVVGLEHIEEDMAQGARSKRLYDFFMHPLGKKPTNITRATVERYGVFERTHGYFCDRAIIPFKLGGTTVGFCAIDLLGKDEWKKKHPLEAEKDYRKTLFPANFVSGSYLFGYDDCKREAEALILVEGPREVMKLWQEGFKNAVAILGSSIKDEQKLLICRLRPKQIILMFDGDEAGRRATDSVAKILSQNFDNIGKCFLRPGVDPKNMNKQQIEKIIKRSKSAGHSRLSYYN